MSQFERGPDITQDILNSIAKNNPSSEQNVEVPEEQEEKQAHKSPSEPTSETKVEQAQENKPQTTPWQSSWQELREKANRIERERDEAIRRLQEIEAQSSKKVEPVDEDFNLEDDSLVEGKQVKKLVNKIKSLENSIKQNQEQAHLLALETRLKAQYPDFDSVVTADNFNALDPEIRATIQSSSDVYAKAASAYKLIKKYGTPAQAEAYNPQKERIAQNMAKPKSAVSIAPKESALAELSDYNGELTPELQDRLYRDMIKKSKSFY